MIPDGMITFASRHEPKVTLDRFSVGVVRHGMKIFARIDHAAGAHQAGLELGPTELLIFGAALCGTPLMQAAQTMAIDLPFRALAWRDASSTNWLSYNDPTWIGRRHGLGGSMSAVLEAMSRGLEALATEAVNG